MDDSSKNENKRNGLDKPKQHYVWQRYLQSWAVKKNSVYLLLDKKTNLKPTNTAKILSQRYFYSIDGLTIDNIKRIEKIFLRHSSLEIDLLTAWLNPVKKNISRLNDLEQIQGPAAKKSRETIHCQFKNKMEDIHFKIEVSAATFLDKLQLGDMTFLEKNNYNPRTIGTFMKYICVQYFRTKKRRDKMEAIIHAFRKEASEMQKKSPTKKRTEEISSVENLWTHFNLAYSLIAYILAIKMSVDMSSKIIENKYQFILLENTSKTPFITSDQPVVNICANLEEKTTEELELYYPISPTKSLLICKKAPDHKVCDDALAKFYNDKIAEQSFGYMIANNEDVLKSYVSQ